MNNRQLNSVISICSSTLKMKYIPSWAQKICSSNSSSHDLNSRDCIPCLMFSNVEHPSPPPSILAQFEAKNVQNNNIVFFLKEKKNLFLWKRFFPLLFLWWSKSFHHTTLCILKNQIWLYLNYFNTTNSCYIPRIALSNFS